MENVLDIKKNKNLNFILPLKNILHENKNILEDVLIVVYLYYEDTIPHYMQYIKNIPEEIRILFVTTSITKQKIIEKHMKLLSKKYSVVLKNNRGRDISGLLVAARSEILKYHYVCFAHDKKEKDEITKKDTASFIECLWENTLGSEEYVYNILDVFKRNLNIGILLPPEPLSEHCSAFFQNTWYQDFSNMEQLSQMLDLKTDLDKNKKPLSVGTVFWARVDALRKLFIKEWTYEDFVVEPLPNDGTMSHAIERSFAYIGQDAGYDTGIVMNDSFAGKRMDYLQDVMTLAFAHMGEREGICTIGSLKQNKVLYKQLYRFVSKVSHIYIYGAGVYGKRCLSFLKDMNLLPEVFIVSSQEDNPKDINGINIVQISELELLEDSGIIIAVSKKIENEIREIISKMLPQVKMVFTFNF